MVEVRERVQEKPRQAESAIATFSTLADVIAHARRVFDGNEALAQEWLCSPNPALDNDVPLMRAASEAGARDVDTILGRIEHGVYS